MDVGPPPRLVECFRQRFGDPARIYRAPGRINLIGEHTDYNDGFVLPAAIDLSAWIAAAPRSDRVVHVYAADLDRTTELSLDDPPARAASDWSDYPRGVAIELERAGHRLLGADLVLASEVPIGAGLSSSAALEVAVAWALLDLSGATPEPLEVARVCQVAENRFVGARCGIMDQFASCHGRAGQALYLDCRSLALRYVELPGDAAIVVCDSMVEHALAAGAYNERRAACEQAVRILGWRRPEIRALRDVTPQDLECHQAELSEEVYRRCRHVVGENLRVAQAVAALEAGAMQHVGVLLHASHVSLRDDYEVSCPELDLLVATAMAHDGVYGSRMMGGGFGGSTITLVRPDAVDALGRALQESYGEAYGKQPRVRVCRTADGAQRVL